MNLTETLSSIVREQRLEYYGVADISAPEIQTFICDHGGKSATGYHRALSIGVVLSAALVDLLPDSDERIRALYTHHVYNVMAGRLDLATSFLASALQAAGHRALPIPGGPIAVDRAKLSGVFSHKLAAHLAGLGWIGKSCMLITPEHGPRVVWGTVLTDAPLAATGTSLAPRCGSCRACVDICPAHAYTGRDFAPAEPREARYDVLACSRYIQSIPSAGPEGKTCGLCLQACPRGRRRNKGAQEAGCQNE